jgi:hypothetical protein
VRDVREFTIAEILPERQAVLQSCNATTGNPRILCHLDKALEIFKETARPRGLVADIAQSDFLQVFQGEGENARATPLTDIFDKAADMALFAVTIGPGVSEKVAVLFLAAEFPLAYMLDMVASLATENAAGQSERHFREKLSRQGKMTPATGILRYSPGYCGWHLSGQKKLFACLRPEEAGITLRESFLMEPLKSISGVLVAGDREIHVFAPVFPCCTTCKSSPCRERINGLGFWKKIIIPGIETWILGIDRG